MCALTEKSSVDGGSERKTVFFNIRLEPAMHAELQRLAQQHERTIAGEIRVALRRYMNDGAGKDGA